MAASFSTAYHSSHLNSSPTNQIPIFSSSQLNPTVLSFPFRANHKSFTSLRCPRLPRKVLCIHATRARRVGRDSWEDSVLKSETPVLVIFYASWCGPCKMVLRVIDEISYEYEDKLNFYVLNTDTDLPIAEDYGVKAVPIVLLFKHGEKRESITGTMHKEFYTAAIERVLAA